MKKLYTAHATTTGGRDGLSKSDDGLINLKLARPGSGVGSNPEQLFAAGYSACFGSAVQYVAQLQKIETGEVSVTADVSLHQGDDGFSISVVLNVSLPKLDAQAAQALVEKAHTVCPYSKATRGNIEVTLNANGQAVAKAA
ncbi:MAG: organic hydroperoxide resistance protein [Alphaproteobacteria bacterium]|nr:organic hydroperoxide resistance protein [Alphaproteobacteria bacterium]